MNRHEYEYLQERLSRLISTDRYLSRNKSQEYRDGVLAAKSVLKDVYEHSYSTAKDDGAAAAIEDLQAEVKDAFNEGYNAGYTAGIGYCSFKRAKMEVQDG